MADDSARWEAGESARAGFEDPAGGGAAASAAGPEALQGQLERLAREVAEAQDRYLRTLAEFDNYRKRMLRDRDDWRRQAQMDLLKELLPALDNFDRALQVAPAPAGDDSFRAGVELIHRDFLAALERVGVKPFATVDQPFDPQRHQAVARVERADVADHTVVAEMVRGYQFHDRVLRPAHVVVAVSPRGDEDPSA
jgi:molecular chaperone GrpE